MTKLAHFNYNATTLVKRKLECNKRVAKVSQFIFKLTARTLHFLILKKNFILNENVN